MWENPRPVRTEKIAVDTAQLAELATAQISLTCLRAAPVDKGMQITVCPVAQWSPQPGLYWLRHPKDAAKILDELMTIDELVSSRMQDGSVLVEATSSRATVDVAIKNCAAWRRVKLVTGTEIEARINSVRQEIDRQLVRLQTTGAMKPLNAQFKALRAQPRAADEKAPAYKVWVTKQLEAQVLQAQQVRQLVAAPL